MNITVNGLDLEPTGLSEQAVIAKEENTKTKLTILIQRSFSAWALSCSSEDARDFERLEAHYKASGRHFEVFK